MRIAIVTETFLPKWDGIANTLCHLLDHIEKRGHQALIFAPEGTVSKYRNTPVFNSLPSFPFPLYPSLKVAPPIVDITEPLYDFHADVVHVVNPFSLGVEGIRAARALALPLVASYHTDVPGFAEHWGLGILNDFFWNYFRGLHNQADLNLAPSNFTHRQLQMMDFERVEVWTRGVDTDLFSPERATQEMRERLSGGEPDKPILLYVGRVSPEKRIDQLKAVIANNPHCRLAIVGEGPQLEQLRHLFAGMPTVFTGSLRNEELATAYASADVFVYPGSKETFGNVVLEAMASALPVVAPSSGGLLDFCRHGDNALLFEPNNFDEASELVQWLTQNPSLREDLRFQARQTALGMSWERTLDGLLDRYRSLINSKELALLPPVDEKVPVH